MIKIKKAIWIVSGILLIIALIFSFAMLKKHYAIKQLKEIPKQEEVEKKVEKEEEPVDAKKEEEASEDPVKDFLSDKVEHAMKLFFTNDIKITAVGDSLTEGIGDEAENGGYVGILSDTINQDQELVEIKNFGKKGNRTDQLIVRLQEPEIEEAIKEADIVLITIGANDIMQIFKENFTDLNIDEFTTGKKNYKKRLEFIFSTIKDDNSNADIYLIGFYNPFKKYFSDIKELEMIVDGWNAVGKNVTERYENVYYIPTKDLFENTTINYFSEDNFHPNHLGYELIAERVLQNITNEGERDEQEE